MSAIIENEDDNESIDSETPSEDFTTQLAMVAFRWLPAQRAYRARQAASRVWMSHTEMNCNDGPEPPSVRA
jgi:hypothetical protein